MSTSKNWVACLASAVFLFIALGVKSSTAFEDKSDMGKVKSEENQQQTDTNVKDYMRQLQTAEHEVKLLLGKRNEILRFEEVVVQIIKWIEVNKLDPQGKKAESMSVTIVLDKKISRDGDRSFMPSALIFSYKPERAE